jgi:ClpP class serine protease
MNRRPIFPGELLAVSPGTIQRDAGGLFILVGCETLANAAHPKHEDVMVVHVRGSLEHHRTEGSDSYEGIIGKLLDAKKAEPSAIIMSIDSRGGVVAGLNVAVKAIQDLFPRGSSPSLVAYVDEMATSAAYALACSCHEIIGPPSCITGSIGTISTRVSLVRQHDRDGVDIALITSGTRKADGHLAAPISAGEVASERGRVEEQAASFYAQVSDARDIPIKKIKDWEAGIFLGPQAKAIGLLDAVLSLDDVAEALSTRGRGAQAKGNVTDRRAG